jgi:hypothetical protein
METNFENVNWIVISQDMFASFNKMLYIEADPWGRSI